MNHRTGTTDSQVKASASPRVKATAGNTALADKVVSNNETKPGSKKLKLVQEPKDSRNQPGQEEVSNNEVESKTDDTQAQRLMKIGSKAILFKDLEGNAWARIPVKQHHEVYRITSREFENWLLGEYYSAHNSIPSPNTTTSAKNVLQAQAQFNGDAREVFTRYAYVNDCIYLDMCDADWRSIKISSSGWEIQLIPDVMFRRAAKSLPLPEPQKGGSVDDLRPYLNEKITDAEFALIKAFIHGCLMPVGGFVLLDLEGEKGSCKSTMTKLLRGIFDPVKGMLLSLPKSEQDLAVAANTSRILSYDNLTGLSAGMSDALCRLSTGGGVGARKLYSDDDEAILDVKRPVIFNGIDSIATKPDLLDRCVIINLQEVGDSQRIDEDTFWKDYETQRPFILGAFLNAACESLKNKNHTQLKRLPRMADFFKWVMSAKDALNFKNSSGDEIDFASIYSANRVEATEIALEADALAGAIKARLAAAGDFSGSPNLIVRELDRYLECKDGSKPTERTIRKRLLTLKPSLKLKGIDVSVSQRTNAGFIISIKTTN